MIHHLSFGVADIERAASFSDAVLAPLGYVRVWEAVSPKGVGYGTPGSDDAFAIKLASDCARAPGPGFHVAFAAPSREAVHAFHAAALTNGGRCNGPPGPSPD